jgi:hypothetical protein
MMEYGYCHRGGCDGYITTHHEMLELAEAIDSKFSDEYIPVPGMDIQTQAKRIKEIEEDDTYDDVVYWESDDRGHGQGQGQYNINQPLQRIK